MIEPGFYMMEDGAFGEFTYLYSEPKEISDGQRDNVMTKSASLKVKEFLLKQLRGMGDPSDADSIYSSSRKAGKDFLDQNSKVETIKKITVQIGNKESYEEVLKIESDPNFGHWIDYLVVNQFKEDYEKRQK